MDTNYRVLDDPIKGNDFNRAWLKEQEVLISDEFLFPIFSTLINMFIATDEANFLMLAAKF